MGLHFVLNKNQLYCWWKQEAKSASSSEKNNDIFFKANWPGSLQDKPKPLISLPNLSFIVAWVF